MRLILALAWRNLTTHRSRSILTAMAITSGVAMVLAAAIIGVAANQSSVNLNAAEAGETALSNQFDPALTAIQTTATSSDFNTYIIQGALAIVGLVILFAAAFVILNAFAMSVTARTQEIGALRTLGMTRRQIMSQVLVEANLLGLSGVILGLPTGIGLAWLVMIARRTLADSGLVVPWWGVVISAVLGLVMTWMGALPPARYASRVAPLLAMHDKTGETAVTNWYLRYGGWIGGIVLSLSLGSAAAAAFIWQPDFIQSSALLGVGVAGLLLGTILIMPVLVTLLVRWLRPFLERRFGTIGRLAADSISRNKTRTVFTIAALTIGLTAVIGTTGLITVSLKGGLEGFFGLFHEDGIIIPDAIALMASGELTPENSLKRMSTEAALAGDLVTAVNQLDGIQTIRYGFAEVPSQLSTMPGSPGIFVDPEVFIPLGNFDFFEGDPESAQAMMQAGHALLLIPMTAERLGVSVGDTIPVQTNQGQVDFTVAGIGGTSSNFTVFSFADGEAYFGVDGPSWLGLKVTNGNVDRQLKKVEALIDPADEIIVFDMRDSGVGGLIDLVGQIQSLLNALLLVAVIVAALGVVNTMVINISERGREIGLLRAVGATQRQIRQAVLTEAALLGFVAAVIATLLALVELLLFVLVYIPGGAESVGLRANWQTAQVSLPPALRDLALASLFAFIFGPLVAALAAYYPARQAAAVNVVEATRSERVSLISSKDGRIESYHRRKFGWGLSLLLAMRNIDQHRLRAVFSALAVSLGVAMIITADYVSSALLATLQSAGEGTMQITHGFIVEQFDLTIGLVGYVLMGAAAFLIFNAFAMSITERQQQLGALRSLGMTRRQILRLVLLEGLLIGGVGALAGLLLGPLMGQSVVSFMQEFGGEFLAFGDGVVSGSTIVLAATIGLVVPLLAALIPAQRATRVSPLAAMRRPEAGGWKPETRIVNRQSLIASLLIALLFIYLAIAPPGEWIESPWSETLAIILVLFWLLGLGLLLPILLLLVGAASRRWLGKWMVNTRLIGDNVQRDRGRVILTVLTLAVGLGTITGLTGFMTYAFDDLMGASIRRIAEKGTWAVFPFDLESGIAGLTELDNIELPAEVITAVQTAAGDRASIVPVRFTVIPELSFFGDSYFTYVADPEVVRNNPNFFQFTEGDWETAMPIMTSGCGALVAPLIANRQNVGIGDRLTITGQNGPMDCTIAGIGAGYVNASIVGENVGDELGATQPIGLSITPKSGVDVAVLETDLQQAVGSVPGAFLTPMSDFAETQDAALSLFVVALNGMLLLAVVAAALGIINTTVINIHERRQELGLLRAVGATRQQIRQIVMGENALIGLVGAIFGVVAGMGSVVILVTTLGGSSWGVTDLDLWPAAGRALRPTISNGIVGILAAPLISAWVSRWPVRSLLRGSAIETLNTNYRSDS